MANLRARLASGEKLMGTMLNIVDHIDMVKILKVCGFDYFIVDNEHGCMAYDKVACMCALAKEMDIGCLVRIPGCSRESILRYLEMGADGLMMPNCNTADEARQLIQYAKYTPVGNRGVSMMRGHTRYIPVPSAAEYMKKSNEETLMIVQVESPESVANIREIMSVEGIDVAFIGPNDLCVSMGIPGQQSNPDYIAAVDSVIQTCKELGKHSGIQTMDPQSMLPWLRKGMDCNLYSNEVRLMMDAAKEAMKVLGEA